MFAVQLVAEGVPQSHSGFAGSRIRAVIERRPSIATLLAGTRRHGPPIGCLVVAMGASKGETVTLLLGLAGVEDAKGTLPVGEMAIGRPNRKRRTLRIKSYASGD